MPADVAKLIAKLKRQHPELEHEPLLDDIEEAAYGDEGGETDHADGEEGSPEEEALESPEEESAEDEAGGDTYGRPKPKAGGLRRPPSKVML